MLVILMFIFKKYILNFFLQQEDDSHIWDILKSKFDPKFHTFDTRLYTCAREFDFLELQTIFNLASTLLLPIALANFIFYLFLTIKKFICNESITSQDTLILYNMFQLISFSIISFLIMRLKLFWTPHLCIFASFIANSNSDYNLIEFLSSLIDKLKSLLNKKLNKSNCNSKYLLIMLLIALMSYRGIGNLYQQHSIEGEYNDYTQESMMNWINKNTGLNDAFVGSMPLMANVKLSTNRPIVNHPHYEDVGLRNRIKNIYSHIYGFRPVKELYDSLKYEYKANYLVIEKHYCLSGPPGKPECAMSQISHLSMDRTTNRQACDVIINQIENSNKYFLKVFNHAYIFIFKIL